MKGYSVKEIIRNTKQPYGGYVQSSLFVRHKFTGAYLDEKENINAGIVGTCVDYLTRFLMSDTALPYEERIYNAFEISWAGVESKIEALKMKGAEAQNERNTVIKFLFSIKGVDDKSIVNACKSITYDVWYRNKKDALLYGTKSADEVNPDKQTVENIREMVKRSVTFFSHSPKFQVGFNFKPNGYTETVCAGDGDFITKSTIWDLKTVRRKDGKKQTLDKNITLQLLMYWIMGQHSGQEVFKEISKIGMFNARENVAYVLEVKDIPSETITEIEQNVICYKKQGATI